MIWLCIYCTDIINRSNNIGVTTEGFMRYPRDPKHQTLKSQNIVSWRLKKGCHCIKEHFEGTSANSTE